MSGFMMARICVLGVLLASAVAWGKSSTEPEADPKAAVFQGAVGMGLGVINRDDYGEGSSSRLLIEPVFHGYLALPIDRLFARGSLHGGYLWQQPEMPRALRIEEKDAYLGLGLGLVWDGLLTVSLSGGPQFVHRKIELRTEGPIEATDDKISRTESMVGWFLQAGVGIPILDGLFVVEPFYRYRWFKDDERESWGYGVEASVQVF
jgi:hypothetical protein